MSLKTIFCKNIYTTNFQTILKFGENIEFTVSAVNSPSYYYIISDEKGDFEIHKIELRGSTNQSYTTVSYDKSQKIFLPISFSHFHDINIYIMAPADFQTVVSVTHRLQIPKARFEFLEPNQMFIDYIVLSNSGKNVSYKYRNVSYKYYGKKTDKDNIEVHIENPLAQNVKLNGQKGDFHYTSKLEDIDLMLSFIFELSESEQEQTSEHVESRPISNSSIQEDDVDGLVKDLCQPKSVSKPVVEKENISKSCSSKECPSKCKWYKALTDKSFHNVTLNTDWKSFTCHHSILTTNSTKFAKAFEDSEIGTLNIHVNNLKSDYLEAALEFLKGKNDAMIGKEKKLFYFADEWNIPSLMEACRPVMETIVLPSNIWENLDFAFSGNYEEARKLCKKYILENKTKIDMEKLANYPQEILAYIFCF